MNTNPEIPELTRGWGGGGSFKTAYEYYFVRDGFDPLNRSKRLFEIITADFVR